MTLLWVKSCLNTSYTGPKLLERYSMRTCKFVYVKERTAINSALKKVGTFTSVLVFSKL